MNTQVVYPTRTHRPPPVDETAVLRIVAEVQNRWPSAGVGVAIVREGGPAWFHGQGVVDTTTRNPVTEDTVFRVGSITKTFTAIAVMQLWEQGLVDPDAPVAQYLRAFRLHPADPRMPEVTLRHLLTHTAGVGYWRRLSDIRRPGFGSGLQAHGPLPSLADYYRRGLPVEVEPGTKWVYSNHGFAALGQVVEDVSGQSLTGYLREHVFDPLGMDHSDLSLTERVSPELATGYVLRNGRLRPVPHRDLITLGASAIYSTPRDMSRYVAALLGGGANTEGRILEPATLEEMFRAHFQPDPRIPGMGLGFWRGTEGTHRTIGHDGTVSGFLSDMSIAPDDNLGVVVLANTGGLDARGAPVPLSIRLLRHLLGLPRDPIRGDVPAHPEIWSDICGWYGPEPGPVTNLFARIILGAGAEVRVRDGQLKLIPLTPIPSMRDGMILHPDDPEDPYVFRVDMSETSKGTMPVVFDLPGRGEPGAGRFFLGAMAFRKRPDRLNPRRWATGGLGLGTAVLSVRTAGRRWSQGRPRPSRPPAFGKERS